MHLLVEELIVCESIRLGLPISLIHCSRWIFGSQRRRRSRNHSAINNSLRVPVTLAPLMSPHQQPEPAPGGPAHTDCLTIEFGQIRIRIECCPDARVLRLVLAEFQKR
jgi:hypothetical protein